MKSRCSLRDRARYGAVAARFVLDYLRFMRRRIRLNPVFDPPVLNPAMDDKFYTRMDLPGHYFRQDLFVAQKIFRAAPEKHVDIGSRIDGFVAHVAAYRAIEVLDIRDPGLDIPGITFRQADIMADDLPLHDHCDSLSSLHVIEHLGLGRYGDPVDPDGHKKGLANISKALVSGGTFYMSVPIGKQRVEFNSHRVFSLSYLIDWLETDYSIDSFSYENEQGEFRENVALTPEAIETNCGCHYGCGIFVLKRK